MDNQAPVIAGCPGNIALNNDPGLCSAVATWSEPTATDNCTLSGSLVWTQSHISGSAFPVGTTTVTYTVTDAAGNTTNCSFDVIVNDNENPTITCPGDFNVTNDINYCGAVVNYNVTSTDNCPGQTVMQTAGLASGSLFPIGTTTNTFEVTDASGNTATCSFDVTVSDTEIPLIFNCPNDIIVGNITDTCHAVVTWTEPTATDNCTDSGSLVWTKTHSPGETFLVGVPTTVTYEVMDAIGNTATCSFNVTVNDTQDPEIPTLPVLSDECSVYVTAPTTTDNCAGTITATTSDYNIPRTFNNQRTYTINWEFDDGNGNVIIVPQTIIIDDVTDPVPDIASLPTINVVDCEIDLVAPTAMDNCEGVLDGEPDVELPITTFGTTIVTWTYDDGNGQIVTQQQSVTLTKPPIDGGILLGRVDDLDPVEFPPSNDVAITACPDDINPVTINLSGYNGTIVQWEIFEAGSNGFNVIPNTSGLDSYHIDFDFSNTKSSVFRVLIQIGTCLEYSELISVHAIPPDVPPILENDYFNVCMGEQISLLAHSGYTVLYDLEDQEGGDFDQGQFPDKWNPLMWLIDGEVAGSSFTAAANNTKFNNWSGTNNHPVGTLYTITYDANDFKFGIAHGDYTSQDYIDAFPPGDPTTLETPILSLIGLDSPEFSFAHAWNLISGDIAKLELSTDGGLTYNITLLDLMNPLNAWDWMAYPPSTDSYYEFENSVFTLDLSPYAGLDQIRIKWTFYGTSDESAWSIDHITLPLGGAPSNEIEWTEGIGDPNIEPLADGSYNVTYNFTPNVPGAHQYGATSVVNGCRAYDPDGTAIADVLINYAYAGEDVIYAPGECGDNIVTLNAYDNTLSANQNAAKNAFDPPPGCTNCDDPGTMTPGKWTIVNSTLDCGAGGSFSNDTDPNAVFTGSPGTYELKWTVGPFGPFNDICEDTVIVQITNCPVVDFDGENDNITFNNNYNLGSGFSIECWIKPDAVTNSGDPNNAIQTIISKRNVNDFNKGYDLRLVNNIISFSFDQSLISSPYPIGTDRWYHIAVTRLDVGNNKVYSLYIDGVLVNSLSANPPTDNNYECIIGAMGAGNPPNKPVNYFSGWIDEVRIWNKALNVQHIRQMMNQEIKQLGTNVGGEVIPTKIYGVDTNQDGVEEDLLTWANLVAYYRMDTSDINCGYLNGTAGKGVAGKLRYITTEEDQTAPMPYTTIADGNWYDTSASSPWTYGDSVWDYPNALGVDNSTRIDWNIVKTSHDIESDLTSVNPRNITLLGLIVDASSDLTITALGAQDETNTGHGLWLTQYLKLDGFMNLIGESQLVQKRYATSQFHESTLDVSSSGYLKRDQQGTNNPFNYNYFSLFGCEVNTIANNIGGDLFNLLKDGTNSSSPQPISWIAAHTATPTSPISVSRRWLYTYNNLPANTYSEWVKINENTTIAAGLGYTMKGSGVGYPTVGLQNYAFMLKPNNNTITNLISTGNNLLTGNPYPSAIDSDEFIKDNIPLYNPNGKRSAAYDNSSESTNGTIYFWDQFDQNDTHILRDYQGGYAVYTLAGGVRAVTPPITSDGVSIAGGNGSKRPGRFIPVAQGFFVAASPTGGLVTLKNRQRVFERENNSSSQFFRSNDGISSKEKTKDSNVDEIKRLRLDFKTHDGAIRPLLLAFVPGGLATDDFDYGYDGLNYDSFPNDLSWQIDDQPYVIQGVGDFNKYKQYPMAMLLSDQGDIEIGVRELENFEHPINVYVYDLWMDKFTKINNKAFKMYLDKGEYKNRFYIAFTKAQNKLLETTDIQLENIVINFLNSTKEIFIRVQDITDVKQVSLINLLGQTVRSWTMTTLPNTSKSEFRIPVKDISEGIYIVKVETNTIIYNKKITITQ
ncbi:HYR domain-containing protein [Flavobacteriaceae bacterium MJ-SS4]|uniref:HYR domain-containing protein n=1 Tax=Gilvirhabdus luticola TaxID=3079858 RepID=UPI0032DD577A